MSLNLIRKIPTSLRNEFWSAFILAVEDEILTMKEEIEKKKTLFTPSKTDLIRLKELGQLIYDLDFASLTTIETLMVQIYDIPPITVQEFLRQLIMKTPFQQKYKGLLPAYQSAFKFLFYNLEPKISVYKRTSIQDYFTGENIIIRDLLPNPFNDIPKIAEYKIVDGEEQSLEDSGTVLGFSDGFPSIYRQEVTNNFLGELRKLPTLDDDEGETLDSDSNLILDLKSEELSLPTKHVSFEFVANQLFQRAKSDGTIENLFMPADATALLYSSLYYSDKKSIEVPHIGSQLTFIIDNSGFTGMISDELEDLGCQAAVNPDVLEEGVFSKDQILYMKFGMAKYPLPTYVEESTIFPEDLAFPIYTKFLTLVETYETDEFIAGVGEYVGQAVGGFPISVDDNGLKVDGNNIPIIFGVGVSSFEDIPFPSDLVLPIRPNTLKMAFVDTTELNPITSMMRITDNGFGKLVSDYCEGTIDYKTGNISLKTSFEKTIDVEEQIIGDQFEYFSPEEIKPNTLRIICRSQEGTFYILDDGQGNLVSDCEEFDNGTVSYTSPQKITINFKEEINKKVRIIFKYDYVSPITPNHILYLYEVFTENPVQITEAGLFVRTVENPTQEQMIAYATFPAFEFTYNYFHLNLGLVFEK